MPKITVKLDVEKDAYNWWEACNRVSHGIDWKERIDISLSQKITNKSQKDAYAFLLPYIEKIHEQNNLIKKVEELQQGFNERQQTLFEMMEKLTSNKIYRDDFTCFLTTFPRCPYDYKNGYVWVPYRRDIDHQLSIFLHELLHFQFFAYYGEKVWGILGSKRHSYLKEAMTVILNDECQNITPVKDEGYEIHKVLRAEFLKIWRNTKDFNLFMDQSIEFMKGYDI